MIIPETLEASRCVLVVDDSNLDRYLVRTRLRDECLAFLEASDGLMGLTFARDSRPDLILLDLRLPGLDGYETLRRLKADPITRSIPVIILSGSTSTIEKAEGFELGAVDFVSKPFDPIELRARVRAALRTKDSHDFLVRRAYVDSLTGLGNRHALEERLAIEWARCRRRGVPMAIWIADLDHFKSINDVHGHAAGDAVLRMAARFLRGSVRASDFVGRYGGEEFVVIAPECDLTGAAWMAARFRAGLEGRAVAVSEREIRVTASVGAASSARHDRVEPGLLLDRADRALYEAKAAGRNAVWAWDPARGHPESATRIFVPLASPGEGGG